MKKTRRKLIYEVFDFLTEKIDALVELKLDSSTNASLIHVVDFGSGGKLYFCSLSPKKMEKVIYYPKDEKNTILEKIVNDFLTRKVNEEYFSSFFTS